MVRILYTTNRVVDKSSDNSITKLLNDADCIAGHYIHILLQLIIFYGYSSYISTDPL